MLNILKKFSIPIAVTLLNFISYSLLIHSILIDSQRIGFYVFAILMSVVTTFYIPSDLKFWHAIPVVNIIGDFYLNTKAYISCVKYYKKLMKSVEEKEIEAELMSRKFLDENLFLIFKIDEFVLLHGRKLLIEHVITELCTVLNNRKLSYMSYFVKNNFDYYLTFADISDEDYQDKIRRAITYEKNIKHI